MTKRHFHFLSAPVVVLLVLTLLQYSATAAQTAHHQMTEPSHQEGRTKHNTGRNMVGGYADADIGEERVVDAAKFAVLALAEKQQLEQEGGDDGDRTYTFDAAAAIGADEVNVIVLEAQKQVVAGMNYRLSIGLTDKTSGECLGGFKCIVYDRFGDMQISIWGQEIACGEIGIIRAEAKRQDEEGDEEG